MGFVAFPLNFWKVFSVIAGNRLRSSLTAGTRSYLTKSPYVVGCPKLFLLCINDLKNVSEEFQIISFADDTNLFLSGLHLNELFAKANNEIPKVQDWFLCNCLCLNSSKTSQQLYTTKFTSSVPDVRSNNMTVRRADSVKFLGLTVGVDELLSLNSTSIMCARNFL